MFPLHLENVTLLCLQVDPVHHREVTPSPYARVDFFVWATESSLHPCSIYSKWAFGSFPSLPRSDILPSYAPSGVLGLLCSLPVRQEGRG